MTLAYIRQMQADCRDRYLADGDEGALLGMHDYFAEEFLMTNELPWPAEPEPERETEYVELAEQIWREERKEQIWRGAKKCGS